MKKSFLLISSVVLIYVYSCNTNSAGTDTAAAGDTTNKQMTKPSEEDMIRNGEKLATIAGCGDCHSPKKMTDKGPAPDMDRLFSGFNSQLPVPPFDMKAIQRDHLVLFNSDLTAAAGPWGISFAANITPDATGIGNWTLESFKRALTEGKSKGLEGARTLLPPMPWQNYKNLKDDEVESIFAYLKSLKPVKNVVPAPKM